MHEREGLSEGRDLASLKLYEGPFEKALEEHSLRKRVLVVHLLREAQNLELVEGLIDIEASSIRRLGRGEIVELLSLRGQKDSRQPLIPRGSSL